MRLTPLDQGIDAGRKYLNERSLQIGHVLPLSEETFKEYFHEKSSFLLYSVRAVDGLFSFRSGREKWTPLGDFVIVTDSLTGLKEAVGKVEDMAVAQEKIVVRTRIFGYDRRRLQALRALDYKVGASIPGAVSLDGKRFDLHYLYKELDDHYHFSVRRSYAKPGLYPIQEVSKAKNQRLVLRGYRKEDRPFLNKAATHLNVIRGISNGVFEGSIPWGPGMYEEWFEKRRVLMDAMKILARRLNLSRVMLTVFEGNAPAEKLYAKAGFVKCGRLPGWLQEGYINETYMVLQLD